MKRKDLKLLYIAMVICVTACVFTYAGKRKLSKPCLPLAAKTALDTLYPNAEIEEVEVEKEGLKAYEVELEQNGQEVEVTLALDGTLMEVETEITTQALPEAVAKAIETAAEGAIVNEVSKETTYAVVELVKLNQPQTSYEAKLCKEGTICEIEVAADGTILEQSEWKMCNKDIARKFKCDKDTALKAKCSKDIAPKPKCDKDSAPKHKCKSHGEHDDD